MLKSELYNNTLAPEKGSYAWNMYWANVWNRFADYYSGGDGRYSKYMMTICRKNAENYLNVGAGETVQNTSPEPEHTPIIVVKKRPVLLMGMTADQIAEKFFNDIKTVKNERGTRV